MSHLFLSDVHIGAFDDDVDRIVQRDLISLIQHCADQNIQIHILGDLFDYWMEYPSWRPQLGQEVLDCLHRYAKKVAPVNYITGNHDNWTNGYFSEIGFNVSNEFFDLSLYGKRLFLHHGDGLKDETFNLPRPWMHRLLRNKMFVKLYQSILPPKAGMRVMKAFSDYSKRRAFCDPSVLDNWADNFLKTTDYNIVISGHDHQPRVINFTHGTYINLGTFFKDRTVSIYNNGVLELVVWDATQKTLYPFEHRYKKAANL
ncbi:UDP-2,3-diacylglucosamine diphosphatase [Rhodohalobacter sp. 8-1]|uniref:UDP-2,3-diacylglucosamine diphosphatase n=1 Tax=Rhodohalobacter sp. 8-1 TaxID=3131972 RepID=UPI0030EC5A24